MDDKTATDRAAIAASIIEMESRELERAKAKVAEIQHRIRRLREIYGLEPSSLHPKRMLPKNARMLRIIAENRGGLTIEELQRLSGQSESEVSFFVKNYRGSRYGLLSEDPDGRIVATERGVRWLCTVGRDLAHTKNFVITKTAFQLSQTDFAN